jgi:hypothetical protein
LRLTGIGRDALRGDFQRRHACDKREAFAQGSKATKQSIRSFRGGMDCFVALAMMEWTAPDGINVPDW